MAAAATGGAVAELSNQPSGAVARADVRDVAMSPWNKMISPRLSAVVASSHCCRCRFHRGQSRIGRQGKTAWTRGRHGLPTEEAGRNYDPLQRGGNLYGPKRVPDIACNMRRGSTPPAYTQCNTRCYTNPGV